MRALIKAFLKEKKEMEEPAKWVSDEGTWDKAKKAADKSYDRSAAAYWPSVVTIYKNMGGTIKSKKEADSASSNPGVLTKSKEGGPGSGRHKSGDRVTHPYHGKGTYIKPNERPGQGIVVFDKEKPLYDQGLTRGHVVSNDLLKSAESNKKTSGNLTFKTNRFYENSNPTPKPTFETVGPYRFKVVLIEEGMGNQSDAFYYPREVLQASARLFEGKKIYADHPSRLEEQDRPERTVRDIVGNYENVEFQIQESTGLGCLIADAVILPDDPYRWARALMRHAVDYSQKYPDKLFIGISINAGGDASPVGIKEYMASGSVPDAAKAKLKEALDHGIETIRVVSQIQSVVSADLVTEPGANGRVLAILESEKGKEMKHKEEAKSHEEKHKEEGAKKPPAADHGGVKEEAKKPQDGGADGADGAHDDEDQDRALIADMLKKALGSDVDVSEDAILAAKEAYEGYKELGHKEEDAMKMAGHSMQLAHHMAKKQEEKEKKESKHAEEGDKPPVPPKKDDGYDDGHDDGHDDGDGDEDDKKQKEEAHKESSKEILKLQGEIARLKEAVAKRDLTDYMDSKLAETKLSRKVTDKIREATKGSKNKADFDSRLAIFMEGYKQAETGASQHTSLLFLEKQDTHEEKDSGSDSSLADCVKEF